MANAQQAGSTGTPPWEAKKLPSKRGLARKLVVWLLIGGVLALVLYGLRPKPIEVEIATVGRGPLTVHVTEEGKTRIRNRYVVAAPVSGQMQRIDLKPGDPVTAGKTVLTVIEPGLAPLLDARAKTQAEARLAATQAARQQAEQALEMARTSARFAETNWQRVKAKASEGSISATDRDTIEREAQIREREVRAAEFALKVAEFEIAQAEAALQSFSAAGSGGRIEVRAPVSGLLLRVMQESAAPVAAGTALVEVGDPADLEIEAEILSRDAVGIPPGAEVSVEQWGGETPLRARVRRVEPAAFTKVSALGVEEQRVIVLSDLEAPPAAVRALGDRYRVEVRVAVWHADDVLRVPSGALFREGGVWKTFVLRDGVARRATIEAGRSDGKLTQVLGGLQDGERVLLHPPDSVTDGSAIQERQQP